MRHMFVDISEDLDGLLSRGLVLTPTERLRRNVVRSFDALQEARGRQAWLTPRVYSVAGYFEHLYQQACGRDAHLPVLLSPARAHLLFAELAPADARHLTPLALDAWRMCHEWGVSITPSDLGANDNSRMFLSWAERVQRKLVERGWTTSAQLPGLDALEAESAATEIGCLAFENAPLSWRLWLDRQQERGCRISALETGADTLPIGQAAAGLPRGSSVACFASPADELASVARWAHQTIVESPAARVGIVVPDLAGRYQAVLRQFLAEFDPHGRGGMMPFDIGGGLPLAEQPIWISASDWLTLTFGRLAAPRIRALFNSPYLELPDPGRWLEQAGEAVSLTDLAAIASGRQLATLAAHGDNPIPRPLGVWLEAFTSALDAAGWQARRAGSQQYQAWNRIRQLISELSLLQDGPSVRPLEALRIISTLLKQTTFAPQRSAAPVQVMGYLETTGLRFSHLWVLGLDSDSWPAAPGANPFVPTSTRIRLQIPRTTAADELAFARQRLEHWHHAADELRMSYARDAARDAARGSAGGTDGAEKQPSALLQAGRSSSSPVASVELPAAPQHPLFAARPHMLEPCEDATGSQLAAGAHRGGSALLADQALCPFRAFARHRLKLEAHRAPHAFPDALDRGELLHTAMQCLFGDSRQPDPAAQDGDHQQDPGPVSGALPTREHLEAAAEVALQRHYQRFPEAFQLHERARLVRVMEAWVDLEATRSAFQVVATESARALRIGGLELELRIDRIDRVGADLLVVDYKTGAIRLPDHPRNRLVQPQLPLYALTDPGIRGVAYAVLSETAPRMIGIADSGLDLGGISLTPTNQGAWEAQLAEWSSSLAELASRFRAGDARVAPDSFAACDQCHLGDVCRISEQRAQLLSSK